MHGKSSSLPKIASYKPSASLQKEDINIKITNNGSVQLNAQKDSDPLFLNDVYQGDDLPQQSSDQKATTENTEQHTAASSDMQNMLMSEASLNKTISRRKI